MRQFADLNSAAGVAVVEWFVNSVVPYELKQRRDELLRKKRFDSVADPFTDADTQELAAIHSTRLERKVAVHQVEILRPASWDQSKGFTLTGPELAAINNVVAAAADHDDVKQIVTYLEHLEDS